MGLGCGCLAIVLVALVAGGLYLKSRMDAFLEKEVAAFVADEPVQLPEVVADSSEIDAQIDRFDAFRKAVAGEGEASARLELDSRQLNILIAHHPLFADIANKARVELQGDSIVAQVSFPLDGIIPVIGGGFVNGQARLSLWAEDGIPNLLLEHLEVNGKALPEAIMSQLKSENLLEDSKDIIGAVQSIVVQDGVLILESGGKR